MISVFLMNCSDKTEKLLVDKKLYNGLNIQPEIQREGADFYVVEIKTEAEAEKIKNEISHLAHEAGRCGGFTLSTEEEINAVAEVLKEQELLNKDFNIANFKTPTLNEQINKVNETLKKENLEKSIKLLVAEGTRSARGRTPNKPIENFIKHINKTLEDSKLSYKIERIKHDRTKQDSIKVSIVGQTEPEKILVLGGHIDSTGSFFSNKAPGADDNASGSAVILETLRALAFSDFKPQKTLEFFWYAGEENGLLGSKEIAADYRTQNKNVEAVMQLDMVLFPGNGDVVGLTTDNTNVELTKIVEDLTGLYVGSPVERFECGYGCSDHASWHNNGFKTVYPFESTFGTHNRNIHTDRDVLNNRTSIEHALKFAKIAVAFLVEMSGR
jgi:leucyl aminopeptidase